jgi:signal transduction histidine kinase
MLPEMNTFEVRVEDTGVGIPQDALITIFDKFQQADGSATRSYGGVGLGLFVARQYANLLGASIDVQSTLGRGTVFTVRLPCHQDLAKTNRDLVLQENQVGLDPTDVLTTKEF